MTSKQGPRLRLEAREWAALASGAAMLGFAIYSTLALTGAIRAPGWFYALFEGHDLMQFVKLGLLAIGGWVLGIVGMVRSESVWPRIVLSGGMGLGFFTMAAALHSLP